MEPTNGSKLVAIKHKQQDELTIKKLDPKHKALLKDCFQYSAIFKDLVQPLKVQGEETGFNKDLKEIQEKLLENYKGINPRTLDTFALSISGLIDILKTMQFSEPEITRYTNIVVH